MSDPTPSPNLEGLRDALLNPGPIERDALGHWSNPALPVTDENVHFGHLLTAFGLELGDVGAEHQMDVEAYDAMSEAGHCNDWTPTPPRGTGWVLASIHDTEDGTVAWFVRRLTDDDLRHATAHLRLLRYPPQLPERDAAKVAAEQGLFRKYSVSRTDRTDRPGGKHYGCDHFVLDVTHDPHAKPALAAYADAAQATHPLLADDMRKQYGLPTTHAGVGPAC